jgi:hypothetical protein
VWPIWYSAALWPGDSPIGPFSPKIAGVGDLGSIGHGGRGVGPPPQFEELRRLAARPASRHASVNSAPRLRLVSRGDLYHARAGSVSHVLRSCYWLRLCISPRSGRCLLRGLGGMGVLERNQVDLPPRRWFGVVGGGHLRPKGAALVEWRDSSYYSR